MRVLIIEDNSAVRARLVSLVQDIAGVGFIAQAADGVEGLERITTDRPEVVLLDLQMPRMNGFRVLETLGPRTSILTVVVLSNHIEYREHVLQRGASFFFDKATQLDELAATLADLASGAPPNSP